MNRQTDLLSKKNKMKLDFNHLLLLVTLLFLSCKKNSKKTIEDTKPIEISLIQKIETQLKTKLQLCYPCIDSFGTKEDIKFLLKTIDKSIKTDVFQSLTIENKLVFSFCSIPHTNGYLDCIYLYELSSKNKNQADQILEKIKTFPKKDIVYKPPKNWIWYKNKNNIYLQYSNTYKPNSQKMLDIKQLLIEYLYQ